MQDNIRLVLVGGGHAHVQVLRDFARAPLLGVSLTLVTDAPVAVYSGRVPDLVSDACAEEDVCIDLLPLAQCAGAWVVQAAALRVDPYARIVDLGPHRPPVPFDLCSLDIGSTVRGEAVPGVARWSIPTRPIGRLSARVAAALRENDVARGIVVVGGGAAGVELAFALAARARRTLPDLSVTLVGEDDVPRVNGGSSGARRVLAAMGRARLNWVGGRRVVDVSPEAVTLDDGQELSAGMVVWATGASAWPFGRESGLPVDEDGWILTRPTLEVVGHPGIFAVGDCAVLADGPRVPRAGVYAVRQGPWLARNLRRACQSKPLYGWTPQTHHLALLNTADGRAIATRGPWSAEGAWAGRLKKWIDDRFVRAFVPLDPASKPTGQVPMPSRSIEMSVALDPFVFGRVLAQQVLAEAWARGLRPSLARVAVGRRSSTWQAQVAAGAVTQLAATEIAACSGIAEDEPGGRPFVRVVLEPASPLDSWARLAEAKTWVLVGPPGFGAGQPFGPRGLLAAKDQESVVACGLWSSLPVWEALAGAPVRASAAIPMWPDGRGARGQVGAVAVQPARPDAQQGRWGRTQGGGSTPTRAALEGTNARGDSQHAAWLAAIGGRGGTLWGRRIDGHFHSGDSQDLVAGATLLWAANFSQVRSAHHGPHLRRGDHLFAVPLVERFRGGMILAVAESGLAEVVEKLFEVDHEKDVWVASLVD